MEKKYTTFTKGDVILTNPQDGFYGIAVVLDCKEKTEKFLAMCHIAITPLLFQHDVKIEDIDLNMLEPLIFTRHYCLKKQCVEFKGERSELMIHIYTTRNRVNFPIIGKINPENIYIEQLLWEPQGDRFYLCGDADKYLGREAYITWCRNNGVEVGKCQ